jgi:acyl-CoA thioesterase-1
MNNLSFIMFIVLLCSNGLAQDARLHPSFVPITEEDGLPRVLLIGDSISMGYTVAVRQTLKGKANVLRPAVNCGPSSRGLESLEEWLGKGKWDVIHFNFGLHDIVYFGADGKTRAAPTDAGSRHQVPIMQYEENLRKIVERMRQTGAKLIWASTTPVPEGATGRVTGDEVKFNAVASRIMSEHMIETDDLYGFVLPRLQELQLQNNVHFTPAGSAALAAEVAQSIERALARK